MSSKKPAAHADTPVVFDIEAAGVQGLKADRSVITHFGWKKLGIGKPEVMDLRDFRGTFTKSGLDDTPLVRAIVPILQDAPSLIAHFGEYFDRPFIRARMLHADAGSLPETKLTDTCLIARQRLCLSSNRLANLAEFLEVDTKKMQKGRGWPDWWMQMLYGYKPAFQKVNVYCGLDVQCLDECFQRMVDIIPMRFMPFDKSRGEKLWTCSYCGGHRAQSRGQHWVRRKLVPRFQCQSCGRWPPHFTPAK